MLHSRCRCYHQNQHRPSIPSEEMESIPSPPALVVAAADSADCVVDIDSELVVIVAADTDFVGVEVAPAHAAGKMT